MPLLKPKHAALAVVALAFHTDMLLYYLLVPLLPRYARELHLDQLQVGLLFGSYAACLLVSTFPLGRAVDRFGRRAVMLTGLLGLGAATLLFAFVHSYPLLVLARGLQGIAGAATWLPGMALLADHFPAEERGAAMGVAFSAANLGGLLGPPLSGFLVEHVSATAPFMLGAALVLVDAAGRAFLLEEAHAELPEPIPVKHLLAQPVVRAFAGAMVLGSGLWALLESTLPLHLDRHFGLGPKAIGLCFA
ncbi:MAG TPA: MFS transporter, partial [Holophagaceae bacterium]|nr:MFS transporter [Holophagaceae bacterium]